MTIVTKAGNRIPVDLHDGTEHALRYALYGAIPGSVGWVDNPFAGAASTAAINVRHAETGEAITLRRDDVDYLAST